MQHLVKVFLCTLALIILNSVFCQDCNLRFGQNPPVLKRFFGSRRYLQYYVKDSMNLKDGETIVAYCEEKIYYTHKDRWTNTEEKLEVDELTFKCSSGSLRWFDDSNEHEATTRDTFSCSSVSFNLFESNKTLSGCKNFMSYGIGVKSLPNLNYSSIGLCYDLDTFSIKYAKYIAYPEDSFLYGKSTMNELSIVELDMELNNMDSIFRNSFMTPERFQQLYNSKEASVPALKNQKFEFKNLLQDSQVSKRYEAFEKLLNIAWWQDLREENWSNFQDEFQKRNTKVIYLVHTGVSGVVKLPALENYEILELNEGKQYVKAPAHIWMYLKAIDQEVEEEFVIVGHNTPFHKADAAVNFCEDICDEVEWLKNSLFGQLHLMPVYGLVNCCRPQDVASKLENFPIDDLKSQKSIDGITTEQNNIE